MWDLRVVTSSRKYTPYRTINLIYNGKEIVTLAYDQTFAQIGCTLGTDVKNSALCFEMKSISQKNQISIIQSYIYIYIHVC